MELSIRKLEPGDRDALGAFLRMIPTDDRTFMKEDLSDPETTQFLVTDRRALRFCAFEPDGAIAGYVAVIPRTGLSSHVGEVRLVVAPARRRGGVGRSLARKALVAAVSELELRKLVVEVVAEQEPSIQMFRQLGFAGEAILRDHLRDRSGTLKDLILLAHFVEDNWNALRSMGLDREVG